MGWGSYNEDNESRHHNATIVRKKEHDALMPASTHPAKATQAATKLKFDLDLPPGATDASRLTGDAVYNANIGATHLGDLVSEWRGSYILTFAGYNAGPRRAREWIAKYGDPRGKDLDTVVDWIERIPFTETRTYVQRVMENYEVYKMRISGTFDIADDLVNGR